MQRGKNKKHFIQNSMLKIFHEISPKFHENSMELIENIKALRTVELQGTFIEYFLTWNYVNYLAEHFA